MYFCNYFFDLSLYSKENIIYVNYEDQILSDMITFRY
jgi:hypothetical protein